MKNLLAFLVLLSACGGTFTATDGASAALDGPSTTSPDAAQPPAPTLVSSSPAAGATAVSFTDDLTLTFSTDMDASSTIAAVTVAPSVSCAGSVSGATYTCAHAALLPSTQYTVIVHGSATSAAGMPLDGEHSYSFTTGAAGVTSLVIAGTTTNELRQGSGPQTIVIAGSGLSGFSSATIGTLPITVGAATDSTLTLTTVVPHGVVPGSLDLVLVGSSDNLTVPDAVVITAIHAAAGAGNDTATGTTSAPFATLHQALSVAGMGDTISLADGTYSAGETWPAALPPSFVNVPDGVQIAGTSTAGTILAPAAGSPAGLDGLVFSGNSGATDLSIHGFQRGVIGKSGDTGLTRVHIYGNTADGAYAMNDTFFATLSSEIDTNGASGIVGADSAKLSLDSTYVHDNTTGAYMSGTAYLDAEGGTRFNSNGHVIDKTNSGVFLTGSATANLEATASMNKTAGIYSESAGAITILSDTIGNAAAPSASANPACSGIVLAGTGNATLSNVESSSNGCAGIAVLGPPKMISMLGTTLHANQYANGWFRGTGPLLSQVSITSSHLSDASVGINYDDFVNLVVSSTSITNDSFIDLLSGVSQPDSSNTFLDCSFGSDAAPVRFPATTGTVTESSPIGSVPNGPSWDISAGSVLGAAFVLRHS